jgi:Na+/H+ antiporter NhaD/arsenite permease-like protein
MRIEILATAFFAVAMLHSFSTGFFAKLANNNQHHRILHFCLHWFSEVEIVFGFWALIFLLVRALLEGPGSVVTFHKSLSLTESFFIFSIILIASTRAIVTLARRLLLGFSHLLARVIKIPLVTIQFFSLMTLGPLFGSVITEPAAITITALLLYRMIKKNEVPENFLYSAIAFLFVNVSIGGALTPYAAPPILMVARPWGWGLREVFLNLGLPGLTGIILNNFFLTFYYRKKFSTFLSPLEADHYPIPAWVTVAHIGFLFVIVNFAHHSEVFLPVTFLFVIFSLFTKKHQDGLKYKEALLVAFFLYGLIVFGNLQTWWLNDLLLQLGSKALFVGATCLTAVTDNAALTYLGSQVEGLSNISKWSLTAGALVGGGLTILANAPNAAGFAVLSSEFKDGTLNALKLFKAALFPTAVAFVCYYASLFA